MGEHRVRGEPASVRHVAIENASDVRVVLGRGSLFVEQETRQILDRE